MINLLLIFLPLFLPLSSIAYAGKYTALIAFQIVTTPNTTEKVLRSQCKECNGTGRVKVGDGRVVFEADCDNCYPDPAAEEVPPAVEAPPAAEPPSPKLYIVGAIWCEPCFRSKRELDHAKIPYTYIDYDKDTSHPLRSSTKYLPTYYWKGEKYEGYRSVRQLMEIMK